MHHIIKDFAKRCHGRLAEIQNIWVERRWRVKVREHVSLNGAAVQLGSVSFHVPRPVPWNVGVDVFDQTIDDMGITRGQDQDHARASIDRGVDQTTNV